ncbi:hypothetical protein C8R46DRAFT_1075979 [Mycena filopes]|nr:hypothetical protein C8R46DRAFT_1075979 [Mycena filopes]
MSFFSVTREALVAGTSALSSCNYPPPPWIGMLTVTEDTRAKHSGTCQLCFKADTVTTHHLYPRAAAKTTTFTREQAKEVVSLCWPCHCIVHRLIPADQLARMFHSIELLNTHRGIQAWLRWSQPHSSEYLRSLMIPCPPLEIEKKTNTELQTALAAIWLENNSTFPRLEGKKTRGHALRQQLRQVPGLGKINKNHIEAAMQRNAAYREWQQWVFSRQG